MYWTLRKHFNQISIKIFGTVLKIFGAEGISSGGGECGGGGELSWCMPRESRREGGRHKDAGCVDTGAS